MSSLVQLRIAGAPADLADGLRLLCRDPHIAQRFGDAGPFLDVWFEPMHQRAAGGGNGASAAGDGVPAAEIQIVPRGAPAASPGAPPSAASVSAAQGPALPPSSSSSSSSSAPAAVPGLAVPTASLGDASAGSVGSNGGGGMASSGTAVIRYARRIDAFRAIGVLLRPAAAALVMRHGGTLTWSAPFKRVGVMLDVSRNAVLTVDSLLWLLQRLALLGVNVMMLYTEDTYTIESQPFFGYMRGRYTHDELRAVDRAALALGIEVVPCIQVLGHMSQALQWPAFDVVRDQQDILLADNADTYRLIEHQLFSCESCFTSRRVHLGMHVHEHERVRARVRRARVCERVRVCV